MALGAAAFGIGIHLGNDFQGQGSATHRGFGIAIVVLAGVQILLGEVKDGIHFVWVGGGTEAIRDC